MPLSISVWTFVTLAAVLTDAAPPRAGPDVRFLLAETVALGKVAPVGVRMLRVMPTEGHEVLPPPALLCDHVRACLLYTSDAADE